jgi:hypothetical protein
MVLVPMILATQEVEIKKTVVFLAGQKASKTHFNK